MVKALNFCLRYTVGLVLALFIELFFRLFVLCLPIYFKFDKKFAAKVVHIDLIASELKATRIVLWTKNKMCQSAEMKSRSMCRRFTALQNFMSDDFVVSLMLSDEENQVWLDHRSKALDQYYDLLLLARNETDAPSFNRVKFEVTLRRIAADFDAYSTLRRLVTEMFGKIGLVALAIKLDLITVNLKVKCNDQE